MSLANQLQTAGLAFRANRRALLWLFLTYIPAAMGAGYLGSWLFHTWILAFIVADAYMIGLMVLWVRMLVRVISSD